MKTIISMVIVTGLLLSSCSKKADLVQPNTNTSATQNSTTHQLRSSTNGNAGVELVYYDSMLVKMNAMELSAQAAASLLAHNSSINILYEADGFDNVTYAIQTDCYKHIWK